MNNTSSQTVEPEEENEVFADDRTDKLAQLRENGYNPYRLTNESTNTISMFIQEYQDSTSLDQVNDEYTLSGRITRINNCGGLSFIDISNEGERIQTVFERDSLENYSDISLLDLGDIVCVIGTPTRTNTGELSLLVSQYDVENKTLRHPPSEHNEMSQRNRIRERSVALRGSELHTAVETRFRIQEEIRNILQSLNYLEVETPILHNEPCGASASTFDTYSNAINEDMSLRIAPELYLKRLLVGDFSRIFEMGRVFRNEDIDSSHNPEFTMLELYETYSDYEDMMELLEHIVESISEQINGTTRIEYGDTILDFSTPWVRMSFDDALEQYVPFDVHQLDEQELQECLIEHNIEVDQFSRGMAYMELYEQYVEKEIVQPTIIYDYPSESTPLCDTCENDDSRIERFEVVVCGVELANAYTELTDPTSQLEAFQNQSDDESIDYDYVNEIAYGLPPTGGLGVGIDRLAMFLTNSQSIKDVIPFPMVSSDTQ